MIYPTKNGYVISSGGVWLPGVYDTEATARYAFQFDYGELRRVQDSKHGGVVTMSDLRALHGRRYQSYDVSDPTHPANPANPMNMASPLSPFNPSSPFFGGWM